MADNPLQDKADSALQWLTRRLWSAISLLHEHLGDEALRAAMLLELGVTAPTPAPNPVDGSDIASIEAYLEADDPEVLAFLEAMAAMAQCMDALETFLTPILEGLADQLDPRDVVYLWVEFATVNLLRYEHPLLFACTRVLGLLFEPSLYEGLKFAGGEFASFRHLAPETEEEAAKHADSLFLAQLLLWLGIRAGHSRVHRGDFSELLPDEPQHILAGWDHPAENISLLDSMSGRAFTWALGDNLSLTSTWMLIPTEHGGPGLFLSLGGSYQFETPSPNVVDALERFSVKADLPQVLSFFIRRDACSDVGADGALEVEYVRTGGVDGRPAFAVPDRVGSRLEIGAFGLRGVVSREDFSVEAVFSRSALVLAAGDPDSFLASLFPADGLRADFELAVGYDVIDRQFFFGGSTKLEVVIPIGKTLGPLGIWHVAIGLSFSELELPSQVPPVSEPKQQKLALALSVSASLRLFAVMALVDRIGYGMSVTATPGKRGRIGLFDAPSFEFVPPRGLGLRVDAGVVKGAGFIYFDPGNDRYAGVLELQIKDRFSLKVVGLIQTGLDEAPGFSLLVIGSFEGLKWQIFAGGMITGLGVVFGMHRTLSVQAFQAGIKNGTLDAILFPRDPVGNAPALLQALRTVFPTAPDQWIVGLSVQAAWLSKKMVSLELGVLVEFSSPTRIALLGQAEIGLPTKSVGLVKIRFDVIGVLDFEEKFLSVDAALRDSSIGAFPLTGEVAARARWGPTKSLAVAVGGLHPRFPLPDGFPKLERLALNIGKGENPRIRGRAYVGLTANTMQFGLGAELYVGAGGFSIEGDFGIDVAFQFRPFRFFADLLLDASVKFKGRTLAGLRVTGSLEGPSPWCARGKVRIKILFLKVTKHFNEEFGDDTQPLIQAVEIWDTLEAALKGAESWRGQLPATATSVASLRATPESDSVDVHPLGELEVSQRVVPLGVEMDKFNNAPIQGESSFHIHSTSINGVPLTELEPVRELFAPGQHFDIGHGDDAISRPSFERFQAGVRLVLPGVSLGAGLQTNFEYEEIVVNEHMKRPSYRRPHQMSASTQRAGAERGAVARTLSANGARYAAERPGVQIVDPGFVAVSSESVTEPPPSGNPLPVGATYTEVLQQMRRGSNTAQAASTIVARRHERVSP